MTAAEPDRSDPLGRLLRAEHAAAAEQVQDLVARDLGSGLRRRAGRVARPGAGADRRRHQPLQQIGAVGGKRRRYSSAARPGWRLNGMTGHLVGQPPTGGPTGRGRHVCRGLQTLALQAFEPVPDALAQ
jgi:hypothetical protein